MSEEEKEAPEAEEVDADTVSPAEAARVSKPPPLPPAASRPPAAPTSAVSVEVSLGAVDDDAGSPALAETAERVSALPEPPPPPGAIPGASKLPPAPIESIEAIAAAVERLRREVAAHEDGPRKARLLYEIGEIQERGGDEPGAARDYLAAYNADTSFREPLEGLVRVLERRRTIENLGKLVEALVAAASTPEERARALTERAIFIQEAQKDLEGARGAARDATETGALPSDLGPAWLTLELVAARLGDGALREEALTARAELAGDPTWRGLLLLSAADLAARTGDTDRAIEHTRRAREGATRAAWAATEAAERIARAEPGLPGTEEATSRAHALAEALDARATLLKTALGDPARGDDSGVPRYVRTPARLLDLVLRVADRKRRAGDLAGAGAALDHALEADFGAEGTIFTRIILTARLRIAELAGDTGLAAKLARRRMENEVDGGIAASLAMRVAEHAASQGDLAGALEALSDALARDPTSAPARALEIDILEAGSDGAQFAHALEDVSRTMTSGEAQGRALLLAAWVWGTRTEDAAHAREALGQAAGGGVPRAVTARLGRSLASLRGDDVWYAEATRALIDDLEPDSVERLGLTIELSRLAAAQGDEVGAARAAASIGSLPSGAWIGRALDALAPDGEDATRSRAALNELIASVDDPALARSLRVAGALRAHAAGDDQGTFEVLSSLAAEDPADPVIAAFFGDLLRGKGDRPGAARVAHAAAEAGGSDPAWAAARHLEAGVAIFRLGDPAVGFSSFESAADAAPEAARPFVTWGARGVDVDGLEGRRAALTHAGGDAAVALERFALEALMGDPAEASSALTALDIASAPDLRLAAALGRLAWTRADDDSEGIRGALETLAQVGGAGRRAAAAERLRIARDTSDIDEVTAAAEAWLAEGGGATAAIEWLAAAMASGDARREVPARRALAESLSDEAREAVSASTTLLEAILDPETPHALVSGSSHAVRLANLELAPPGCDPRRRATVLSELDGALGDDTELDALGLAAWSALAAGDPNAALEVFTQVAEARPEDLHAWEGMRAAAQELGDRARYASACEEIGARAHYDARGAAFWEEAALAWLDLGGEFEVRGEMALDQSFARDPSRPVAFDRLFRRVRERKDGDKLLGIVARRLEVAEDPAEIAKLYWEEARVLREKGDPDGALAALEHVTMIDENHVGALALTGEIFIRRGRFEEAAEKLARLARVEIAPPKNRVTAGVAAVDLYENKLQRHDLALEVLLALHTAGLTNLPVRERLARSAARTGSWDEATRILEELMQERPESEGRAEAARLAMAIHRDRRHRPADGVRAAEKLLDEISADGEAIDLIVGLDGSLPERRPLLERARDALLLHLHEHPGDLDGSRRLARVSHSLGDTILEQSALSCAVALGGPDGSSEQTIAILSAKKPRVPEVALTDAMKVQIAAPGDDGPLADLFRVLGPTIGEALGPTRDGLGVGRRHRVDPRSGALLRGEIASWAGAFGIAELDVYVGGKDPGGVQGIAGETAALVVGLGVNAPLSPASRARVARELFAISRGTTITRWRDDTTIAAVAVAACNIVKVKVDAPPFPVLAEVERQLSKALSRKTKAQIEGLCRLWAASTQDPRLWASRARTTLGRLAVIASGDVGVVLTDVFAEPIERLGTVARDDLRAHDLLRFVLSRPYFDLRRAMGLEGRP